MKLRERDEPLDPEVERDLDAVDRALAGRPVDPDLAGWEELTALLTAERPDLDAEWAEELDRRETARLRSGGEGDPLRRLAGRVGMRPGRMLAPAGALATLVVVGVVAGVRRWSRGATSRPRRRRSPAVLESTDSGGDEAASSADSGGAADADVRQDFAAGDRLETQGLSGALAAPEVGLSQNYFNRPRRSPPVPRSGRSSAT